MLSLRSTSACSSDCCVSLICCVSTVVSAPIVMCFFFLMIRRPPRSTLDRSSAASDVYKRQPVMYQVGDAGVVTLDTAGDVLAVVAATPSAGWTLSLIHISEPTRPY